MFYPDILKFVLNVQSENILYKACAAAQNFIWNFKIPELFLNVKKIDIWKQIWYYNARIIFKTV